jgi:hypothetical protein
MWTLVLLTVVINGAVTGGVAATTAFLDFPDEARCRSAATGLATTERVGISERVGHPNISPPAYYRVVARCVER